MNGPRHNLDPELEAELERHRREAMDPPTVLESAALTFAVILGTVLLLAGLAALGAVFQLTTP